VGFDTSDDAAVYRVAPDMALISTVDYITPPVNDPYWFGQIAAANSLSDVYAMGGKPLTALNLVMFPAKKLDMAFLKDILRGGSDKVLEADASMAGGHSVDDNEPKYGLAVTGSVHPDRILTNCGCLTGDALILTKPLGTGVLFNANRSGKLPYSELEAILPRVAALNRKAIEVALKFDVHAPFYPNALRMYQKGETTGSNKANRRLAEGAWEMIAQRSAEEQELLFDPQTSGGLLIAVPDSQADDLIAQLKKEGIETTARVGEVVASDRPYIRIV
jgi:selenide,water dikinase